jgi:hypothetical protein
MLDWWRALSSAAQIKFHHWYDTFKSFTLMMYIFTYNLLKFMALKHKKRYGCVCTCPPHKHFLWYQSALSMTMVVVMMMMIRSTFLSSSDI